MGVSPSRRLSKIAAEKSGDRRLDAVALAHALQALLIDRRDKCREAISADTARSA